MSKLTSTSWNGVLPSKQQGIVLLIALIVLVAMTLAGLGLMRSVDTTNLAAGNLAFKQASMQTTDRGIQAAFQWLGVNRLILSNSNAAQGYFSARPGVDPDWADPATWDASATVAGAPNGFTVSYMIHRLCTQPDTAYNGKNGAVFNSCSTTIDDSNQGQELGAGEYGGGFQGLPRLYYRVTARVVGPRNTLSVVQSTISLPI